MEEGVLANALGLLLEGKAALCLDLLQGGEVGEADIGERLVGQRPEVLGGLEFGGVGRLDEEMNAVGHLHLLAGMPAGAIKHQRQPLGRSCANILSKGSQHLAKDGRSDRGQEPPLGLPGGRPDKATDIQPLVALLDWGDGTLADGGPDPPNERQETGTRRRVSMLVGGPQFHTRRRMGRLDGCDLSRQIFF